MAENSSLSINIGTTMAPWASVKEKEALRRASEMARGIVLKDIKASELSFF